MNELSASELHALITLLDDTDQEVRGHVRDRLIGLGTPIIPILEEKWEELFNPEIQYEIELLVHELQFTQLKNRLLEWKKSEDQDLLTGLWIINTYQYPDLEFEKINASMHQIYFEVWTAFKNDASPYDHIKIINDVLFQRLRFSANTKNFHSPGNSMISTVLDTKKGNPILLCSIYLLVSQKLGLPIYGVNLPNIFILTYKSSGVVFYINAFNKGVIFSKKDIQNYLEHLEFPLKEEFFEPTDSFQMMLRCMRNLSGSFEKLGEVEKKLEIDTLIQLLLD